MYGQLKLKWGLGHIKCIAPRLKCSLCKARHAPRIVAYYVDEVNVKQNVFLDYDFQQALARVNTIKLFL